MKDYIEDPLEYHLMISKKRKRLVNVIAFFLLFSSIATGITLYATNSLNYFPIAFILFATSMMIWRFKETSNYYKERDEYEAKKEEEFLEPFRNNISSKRETYKEKATKSNHVSREKSPEKNNFTKPSYFITGKYEVQAISYIASITIPFFIAVRLTLGRSGLGHEYPILAMFVFLISFLFSGYFLNFYFSKSKFVITIDNSVVRLSTGDRFDLADIRKVEIKEPIATKALEISYTNIYYNIGKSIKKITVHKDIKRYDELIDIFLKST